ncbi:hypothetical protein HDK90DRAFT_163918 [Phyllosticta capitalensis]|uniref:Uncharacterized protein n=1 Tax=Phyllosticta capitalensis TaxID=121624 RepID=A0ABR1Z147_9PEZI
MEHPDLAHCHPTQLLAAFVRLRLKQPYPRHSTRQTHACHAPAAFQVNLHAVDLANVFPNPYLSAGHHPTLASRETAKKLQAVASSSPQLPPPPRLSLLLTNLLSRLLQLPVKGRERLILPFNVPHAVIPPALFFHCSIVLVISVTRFPFFIQASVVTFIPQGTHSSQFASGSKKSPSITRISVRRAIYCPSPPSTPALPLPCGGTWRLRLQSQAQLRLLAARLAEHDTGFSSSRLRLQTSLHLHLELCRQRQRRKACGQTTCCIRGFCCGQIELLNCCHDGVSASRPHLLDLLLWQKQQQ